MGSLLNKIYTRGGDKGKTALIGGDRVSKNHPRVEAYGTIDELNAWIGLIRTKLESHSALKPAFQDKALETFMRLQNKLFDAGSMVARPKPDDHEWISSEDLEWLESQIDEWNESLEPLNSFTLPGGSELNATTHLARTVCRRAERQLVYLEEEDSCPQLVLAFINRLSDALFVFSRVISKEENKKEYLWDTMLKHRDSK